MFSAVFWFCLYAFVIVLPTSIAAIVDPIDISRPHLLEFGVALGLIAYSLLIDPGNFAQFRLCEDGTYQHIYAKWFGAP